MSLTPVPLLRHIFLVGPAAHPQHPWTVDLAQELPQLHIAAWNHLTPFDQAWQGLGAEERLQARVFLLTTDTVPLKAADQQAESRWRTHLLDCGCSFQVVTAAPKGLRLIQICLGLRERHTRDTHQWVCEKCSDAACEHATFLQSRRG